jgi:succinate-semialdehyde dehydrogenase/glutarate-semialdehyde dehydrogenase
VGVVGQIVARTDPLALTAGDALPTLAAGNAVVTTPDTEAALSTSWLRGLSRIVIGEGTVVGRTVVVEHADYACFTGSTRTGREVGRRASSRRAGGPGRRHGAAGIRRCTVAPSLPAR